MFENLKDEIVTGYIHLLDNIVYSELRAITVNDRGNIELANQDGAHSDNAVALSLAYMCLQSIRIKDVPYLPHWIKAKNARKTRQTGGVAIASKRRYN